MNRNLKFFFVVTITLILGVACTDQSNKSNSPDSTPNVSSENNNSPIKTYRHSMDGTPTSLDPVQGATLYSNFVILNTYDTLYSYEYLTRPYKIKPNLAVAMPDVSEDGLVYTIKIKPGVYFVDDEAFPNGKGREVIASDFVYSIKRHFDPKNRSQGAWLWQGKIKGIDEWKAAGANYDQPVEGLTALDNYTLQITLNTPYPQLTYSLAMGFSAFVPREAAEHYGRELSVKPIGSGPFKMESFTTAKAILTANEKFREEPIDIYAEGYDPVKHAHLGVENIHGKVPPLVDRLEIDFVVETSARWNSFTKGSETQYTTVPKEQVNQVVSNKNPVTLKPEFAEKYHMHAAMETGFVFYGFNMDDPSIGYHDDPAQNEKNKALRCAIRKGFNWNERNEAFYFGIGYVFPGIVTPVVPEYDPNLVKDSITYDLEGAKALLASAGWDEDNLPTIEYGHTAAVTYRQMFEQFRGWMLDLGFPQNKVTSNSFATFGDFNRALKQRKLQYFGLGWQLDYPDAQNTLQLFYGPYGARGFNNFKYNIPDFDKLYVEASVLQPGPKRTEIYQQLNQMVLDDCVLISGLSRTKIHLWHKDVVMLPDREILGGFFVKYADLKN